MPDLSSIVNLNDFQAIARYKLDPVDYDYFACGAEDEVTLKRNKAAWRKYTLWPRCLVDVSQIDLSCQLLGIDLSMPVIIPPMAMQRLAHPDGEPALARAAQQAGLLYCIAQQATTKMETICEEAPGLMFFQMYIFKNRSLSEKLIQRAERCGVRAIVVTVDSPVLGRRERDLRNRFTPAGRGVEIVNWKESGSSSSSSPSPSSSSSSAPAKGAAADVVGSRTGNRDTSFTWEDIQWLKSVTKLPLVLKGIVHPADAELAVRHGCAAVWVSNHGGRQLDGGPGTGEALPLIARAVRGRIPVIVDGGIQRGTDVIKALALGATAVAVGRPMLWALATSGEEGATLAVALLRNEISSALALSGLSSASAIPRALLERPSVGRGSAL